MTELVAFLTGIGVGLLLAGYYFARRARRFDALLPDSDPSEFSYGWAPKPRHHDGGAI